MTTHKSHKPGRVWHPEFRGPMTQTSEHTAAGVSPCYYCGETVNTWDADYVIVRQFYVAHRGCEEYANEERMALDHEAMKEQGD